jgi:hypothetical protein
MLTKPFTVTLGLTAMLLGFGCDKGQSTSTPSPTTPATPSAAVSVATGDSLPGVYNAVSNVESSVNRRHQQLTLNTDLTAQLDTDITIPGNPNPTNKHTASGDYVAKADDITVTLNVEDGKPIPASNTTHVMHLTAQKSYKSLLGDDGRTFERAK